MAKKKRNFHCQKCNSELTIYKKGKKHRVLVCPLCGIIATNPFVSSAGSGALLGAEIGSVIPGVGTAVGAVAGGLIGGGADLISSRKKKPESQEIGVYHHHKSGYPLNQKVHDALK